MHKSNIAGLAGGAHLRNECQLETISADKLGVGRLASVPLFVSKWTMTRYPFCPLARQTRPHNDFRNPSASPRNVNERNLFRMTDSLANKTFSFAPAGSSPPTSPRGGRRLDRQRAVSESNEMSGDMVYGSGPGPTLHRRIGSFRPVSLSGAAFRERWDLPVNLYRMAWAASLTCMMKKCLWRC